MRPFSASRRMRGEHRVPVHRFLFALALLVAAPAAPAQASLSLADALAQATPASPAVQSRSAQLEAARETAAQADQLPDPQLVLGVENLPIGASPLESDPASMTMRKIGLMQAFPAPAKRRARRALADRFVKRAQALTGVERLAVQEQVAQAWFAAWAAQQELDILQRLRERAAVAVQIGEARLKGGTGSAVEAMAAKAAALEVDSRIEAANAVLLSARAGLATWMGIDPADLPGVGAAPDLGRLPVSEAVLLATIDEQRRLVEARSLEAIAEARVQEAIADKRPDWSLMAAYGQRDGGRDDMREDMLMVEARVDLPLFASRRQDRRVAARRAELQSATADRLEAERAQRDAVRRALAEWRGLRAQTELHERHILPLADDRSEAALAAYRAGAPLEPWLDARRDEIEAHLMHVRHLGELARIWASLAYLLPAEAAR